MAVPSPRVGLFAVVILLSLAGLGRAGEPPAGFEAKAKEYMAAREKLNQFSGAVLVGFDGKPVFRGAYGTANYDFDQPNTPATKFRIGSVTKQFTAVAVLMLEEQGKLATSDPIGKHLPDCPKAWADVTVHQLLSHTGGIPEHTNTLFLQPGGPSRAYTPAEIVGLVKDKPLAYTPGEKWAYSNTGYVMLGQIVEAAAGKPYGEFLQESIFSPLGMTNTGVERNGQVLKTRAGGYNRNKDGVTGAQIVHMSLPYAAGAMYSTVDDLLAWDRALATNKLLKPAATEKLFTVVKDDYAYGIGVTKKFGTTVQEHGGGIPGFVSQVARYPEKGVFVVVLTNVQPAPVSTVANELAALALGEAVELPRVRKPAKVDPESLSGYAGEYTRENQKLTVSVEDGAVRYRIGEVAATGLTPEAPGRFYNVSDAREIDARFVSNDAGTVTHLLLRRNGVETKWERAK